MLRYGIVMAGLLMATTAHAQMASSARGVAPVPAGCNRNIDSDADRLPDCVETQTGVFLSQRNTGTHPNVADTDGDGISDSDEIYGVAGVNLPAMGTNPNHKDLLIEEHWFDESRGCGVQHSHALTAAQRAEITAFYASIPVENPDGKPGVNVAFDYGQGGPFTRGGLVPAGIIPTYGHIIGGVYGLEFQALRRALFDERRHGYFHFYVGAHSYVVGGNGSSSGNAAVNGFESMVTLQCEGITNPQWTVLTFIHEMGHNLGLHHGGNQTCNHKPNYNSIMNYRYQFQGADDDCDGVGDGQPDYSYGVRPSLDENNLDENNGMCQDVHIDWNLDQQYSSNLAFDLNSREGGQEYNDCGGILSTLHDSNDWAGLNFPAVRNFYDVPALPAGTLLEGRALEGWTIQAQPDASSTSRIAITLQAPTGTCMPADVSTRKDGERLVVRMTLTDACEAQDARSTATFIKPASHTRSARLEVCQSNAEPLPSTCAIVAEG